MNVPPIDLGTNVNDLKPTPPLARRRFSAQEEKIMDDFIETSLKSGLISQCQSPVIKKEVQVAVHLVDPLICLEGQRNPLQKFVPQAQSHL